jgi:hypothetical protein
MNFVSYIYMLKPKQDEIRRHCWKGGKENLQYHMEIAY